MRDNLIIKKRTRKGLTWSCSRSYISCVESNPSLFKSKWLNIHFASILQVNGNRATNKRKRKIRTESEFLAEKRGFTSCFFNTNTTFLDISHDDRKPIQETISNICKLSSFTFRWFLVFLETKIKKHAQWFNFHKLTRV